MKPRPHACAIGLGLLAAVASGQVRSGVLVYHSESEFFGATEIASTETFDEFPPHTLVYSPAVTIDEIVYETDGPCPGPGAPACWTIGIHVGPGFVSPPNDFGANFGEGITEHRIGFGAQRDIHAIGFWFLTGGIFPPPRWEIVVHEIDGNDTIEIVEFTSGQRYFGFVSDVGIGSLTVRDAPGDKGAHNWSYDDVSRSAVFPTDDFDGDGVPDDEDRCRVSDLSAIVVIDDCSTNVANRLFVRGCTISDRVTQCAGKTESHGQFVSCVSNLTVELRDAGILTGRQRGAIQRCAAHADF
jgi:hypothetical protein